MEFNLAGVLWLIAVLVGVTTLWIHRGDLSFKAAVYPADTMSILKKERYNLQNYINYRSKHVKRHQQTIDAFSDIDSEIAREKVSSAESAKKWAQEEIDANQALIDEINRKLKEKVDG